MTIPQFEKSFPDEGACHEYLMAHRWPGKVVVCPRCGATAKISPVSTMPYKWQCYTCSPASGYRFSVIAGTIFENTNKPLREWFRVIHMMLTSKKGVSALQVQRVMGFGSYRTAWYMCHRVRAGLADEDFRKLMGIVEVDETWIGGELGNKHVATRRALHKAHGNKAGDVNKTIVAGAVERGGNVVARVIANVSAEVLQGFVREAVSNKVSLLCTDEWRAYDGLKRDFFHRSVVHKYGQYVVGAVHTQTIEGFWSLVKRGMVGTFHKVSAKYLPLYIAEFQFRYNNRLNDDIFGAAMSAM
jgi:IS1 family transposase/transposase-like protein